MHTWKERLNIAAAFIASACAGYGAMYLVAFGEIRYYGWIPEAEDAWRNGAAVGIIVFFWTLYLMLRGVDAISAEAWRDDVRKYVDDLNRSAPQAAPSRLASGGSSEDLPSDRPRASSRHQDRHS